MDTAARWAIVMVTAFGLLSGCSGGDAEGAGGGAGGTGGAAGGTGGGGGTQPPGQPLDRSDISFVDNLLAKVADGEWTLGEGLVATLQLMAGEIDASSVLRNDELLTYEGTGIIRMAYEYLETGEDTEAKSEVTRLLNLLVFSDERLDSMTEVGAEPALIPKGSPSDCLEFFTGYSEVPPGVGNCLEVRSSPLLDDFYPGAFRIFAPAPPLPTAGWTEKHYELALQTMEESVPILKARGKLHAATIAFAVLDEPKGAQAWANPKQLARPECDPNAPDPKKEACKPECGIALFKNMQKLTDGDFKQTVAHELAHCFQQDTFPDQNQAPYACMKWRDEGLAEYLGNVVYPHNNSEWPWWGTLAKYELHTSVLERAYTNCFFFQQLGNWIGDSGIVNLVKTLPTSGKTDAPPGATEEGACTGESLAAQAAALAKYGNMDVIYHDFAKALTDRKLMDTGGQMIPYQMAEVNRPTLEVTEPHRYLHDMDPFGVYRSRILVESDKEADITFEDEGEIRDSSRPTNDTSWGDLPMKLQGDQCEPGVILVVTTTRPGSSFDLDFSEVRGLPGGMQSDEVICGIVGTWVVDNSSLKFDPGEATRLDHVSGQISITFKSDGTAEVVYSSFEYQFVKDVKIEVGGLMSDRHDEFTWTTNATGVTSYEVDGNEIEFGHFFESSYLNGIETRHFIRTYTPRIVGEDIDEVTTRDARGRNLFSGSWDFDIQSGGSVLRFRNGDDIWVVLNRSGSADE
ncbi:MAG: hypothetical protein JRE19_17160 [Deltaproteobacteria bacterium]|nr:hypothetical protein [Deltaproteobacteria bacterium]